MIDIKYTYNMDGYNALTENIKNSLIQQSISNNKSLYKESFNINTSNPKMFINFLIDELKKLYSEYKGYKVINLHIDEFMIIYIKNMITDEYIAFFHMHVSSKDNNDLKFNFDVYGDALYFVQNILDTYIASLEKISVLDWYYKTQYGPEYIRVPLIKDKEVLDEAYPFINGGIKNFYKKYLESNACILLLIGEPGTGKTSFIRDMAIENSLNCRITYDEDVIIEEKFLIKFLTQNDSNILIIEDSDTLIRSREQDNNKIMNKLLNISDGLLKTKHKKIIFSTNLSDIKEVDEALIRPGRCFDVVNFRKLNYNEAKILADKIDVELIDNTSGQYSLAEIYNEKENSKVKTKIGFV